jgi:hypothetical protein
MGCALKRMLRDLIEMSDGCDSTCTCGKKRQGAPGRVDSVSTPAHDLDMGFTGGEPQMTAVRFKQIRAAAGVTMEQAAKTLNVSLKTIWRWENGKAGIDGFKASMIKARLVPGLWAKLEAEAKEQSMVRLSMELDEEA